MFGIFIFNFEFWNNGFDIVVVFDFEFVQVEELRSNGLEPYAYKWDRTHSTTQLQTIYEQLPNGEEAPDIVSVSGRIMSRRAFGKLAFLTLRDQTGTIQVFVLLFYKS